MSARLCHAVHALYIDRDLATRFRDGDLAVLDAFELTAEERAALASKDLVRLYGLQVHPILVFHLSAVLNSREWYIREVVPNIQDLPNRFIDYYRGEGSARP
jgi:predicted kinase